MQNILKQNFTAGRAFARSLIALTLLTISCLTLPLTAQDGLPKQAEMFEVGGHQAFVYAAPRPAEGKPWVWYAPTIKNLAPAERKFYYETFAKAGISIAGFDLGEVRGSPASTAKFTLFYDEMVKRGYSPKPILLGQSRGGMMTLAWAFRNPDKVRAWAGIYPVCNLASWSLKSSKALTLADFAMTEPELVAKLPEFNPIDNLKGLLQNQVPMFAVHGDSDALVPYDLNTKHLEERYQAGGGKIQVKVIPGIGHQVHPGFFACQELVDFVLTHAAASPVGKKIDAAAIAKTLKLPGLVINTTDHFVDIDAVICLDEGALELIACTKDSKEHESIVMVEALPIHIHTALLLLGAKNGNPAMRRPIDKEETRWMDIPPQGDPIEVFLVWKDDQGNVIERPISDFVERSEHSEGDQAAEGEKEKFPNTFLFAGSHLGDPNQKPRKYLAQESGNVISISTFGDEVLCLPEVYSQENGALSWQVDSTHLPKFQSRVTLRLRVKKTNP